MLLRYSPISGTFNSKCKRSHLLRAAKQTVGAAKCFFPFSITPIELEARKGTEMIRLYKSALHPRHWVACVPGTGWVAFPARENGWQERHPAKGLDPLHLREVPIESAV